MRSRHCLPHWNAGQVTMWRVERIPGYLRPPNTPQSGTSVVTVKKASPADHGTGTGWVTSYGTDQAVFASHINIQTGYFVLDGQYRNEGDWFDGAAYGFKIQHFGDWQHLVIRATNSLVPLSNITIKYFLYIAAVVGQLPPSGQGYRPFAIDTETLSSTIRNVNYVFSRVYVDGSNNPFFVRTLTSSIIEYVPRGGHRGRRVFMAR